MMEQCKEKLNIAMFGQKRIPSREGGVEIVVEELCSRMVAQSPKNILGIYIIILKDKGESENEICIYDYGS